MRKLAMSIAALGLAVASTGCVFTGAVDLGKVATDTGMKNITTGDGTFENYTAVSYEKATEVGISLGIFVFEIMELYPGKNAEALLMECAENAKEKGADAMINVSPEHAMFSGFIIGLSIDSTAGTGIKTK